MPTPRRAIPARLEGRSSLASFVETLSLASDELASRLRKPTSLIKDPRAQHAMELLDAAAQSLSDLAVGISLGHVEVLSAPPEAEAQMTLSQTLALDAPQNQN